MGDIDTVPCVRCGNPRQVNAYCSATTECRRLADENAAAVETFFRTGKWPAVPGAGEEGR
jgi:hypothetical protein